MSEASCEGLGALADRVLLSGRVADFQRAPCTWVAPSWVFSSLAAAAARSAAAGSDARAAPSGVVCSPGASLAWLAGTPGGVEGGPGWDDALARRATAAATVSFDPAEREIPGPLGNYAVADAWVFDVSHWSGLLWANLLALGPHLWAALVGSPWRLAWAAIRATSAEPTELARVLSHREPGARVHRAGTVEGSWLGRGASVGAGAIVRGAFLGEGAVVEDLAIAEGCVLGPGARVQRQAMVKFSLVEDAAAVAGVVQLGVVGRGAQVKQGAVLMDQGLGDVVRVRIRGELVPAPRGMIGGCVGPGAVLGQGVRVAPGRAIPPGLVVVADPAGILRDVDVPAGTTRARAVGGRLEPVS